MSTALRSRSRSTVAWLGLAAGLGLTFLLPRSAAADCDWVLTYYLYNDTTSPMTLKSASLQKGSGKWEWAPHEQIGPGQGGSFRARGVCGTWTGIQGAVEYVIDDGYANTLRIDFDVPFSGANHGDIGMTGPYKVEYHGANNGMPSGGHKIDLFPHIKEQSVEKIAVAARPAVRAAETATSTEKQVMLSMAFAANLAGDLTGDSASVSNEMAPLLNCFLGTADAVKDQWTVVWGPEVVTKQYKPSKLCKIPEPPDKVPANTMFVAKKNDKKENTYVIGIAGTNKSSAYAWCEEDFNIVPVHWPYGEAKWNADATLGTLKGLQQLQDMSDPDPRKGSLRDFLKTVTGERATIYITGHSLGGALAPALAQWLADTRSTWDPKGNATLQIFAFAGATPGNRVFADHVNRTFPGEVSSRAATQPFSMVIVNNTLDVVPHAWNALSQVPNLYQAAGISPSPAEMKAINGLQEEVDFFRFFDYHYAALGSATQQQSITGQLLTKAELNPYTSQQCPLLFAAQSALDDFGKEALYQHVCAYPDKLGLPGLWTQYYTCADSDSLNARRSR